MASVADLALMAPLVGIIPGEENPCTLHAVTDAAIVGTLAGFEMVTACQLPGVQVLPFPLGSENPAPWPPPHKLPKPFTRCRGCWLATGKKRPACELVKREEHRG